MAEIVCTVTRPDAERVVAIAGDLADRLGRSLVLVDLRPLRPQPAGLPVGLTAQPLAPGEPLPVTDAPAPPGIDLEDLARRAGVRPARCETMEAPPVTAIVDLSARPGVDMLVADDRGAGPLTAALAGDAPRLALRDLHAPLLLLPGEQDAARPLGERPLIVCAVDDDDAAAPTAARGADLARGLHGELAVVHAGDRDGRAERTLARCEDVLREAGADLRVIAGSTAGELHAWAADNGADLLVAGTPRHGVLMSALLGSAVHDAARRGSVPLLVVPDDDRIG